MFKVKLDDDTVKLKIKVQVKVQVQVEVEVKPGASIDKRSNEKLLTFYSNFISHGKKVVAVLTR